ncbi:MAG: double-strand break repair protein AddB [Pseudomonadota bacterium]
MTGLFDPGAAKVYSIPAGANFLAELTERLADETDLKAEPEALADALIYVPNRRSERALGFALHQAAGGRACLLPNIRVLGDLETDDPPPSAETALADLPPVISPSARIGGLTRLVMKYFETMGSDLPAVSCLAAARELARLLDQAALSGDVDWSGLEQLVPEAQLAQHWKRSVKFLEIITDQWPAQLDEATKMDPYARRYAAAEAVTAHWRIQPPSAPVIVAGSTGATPASRLLMQAALSLPQGIVVLPGLDTDLDETTLRYVSDTPSHPQYTLARTLRSLGISIDQVAPWRGTGEQRQRAARRRLIHQALAPAESTADWTTTLSQMQTHKDSAAFVQDALRGLTVLDAADDGQEALLAALLMRETLETEGQTAALVTPDAGLARHVSALLKRWDVDVAPSAGIPLSQTDAGSFTLLVADWLLDPSHPVALMSVLQHPVSRFEAATVQALDKHFLRGPRIWQNWTELAEHIHQVSAREGRRQPILADAHKQSVIPLIESVGQTLSEFQNSIDDSCPGEEIYRDLAAIAGALADDPYPWAGDAGGTLSTLLRDLSELAEPLGPQPLSVWGELLQSEAVATSVPAGEIHPRLAIWGPLEARLQSADRVILAGLNEDVWPAQPAADAFLPRIFRKEIGMSDPDERIGLSAHDFAQLASAPDVVLLNSQRRDDKPAISSRWLWRLKTLVRGVLGDAASSALAPSVDRNPLNWLHHLEEAPPLPQGFSAEPRPRPPVAARPDRLSVTRVEQLVRDPYAIYCETVLGLRRLDPLNLPPDSRVRGTAVHKALERFEDEHPTGDASQLLQLLEFELRRGGEAEADLIALRDKRRQVCAAYLEWRAQNAGRLNGAALTEIRGALTLEIAGAPFTLSGTADRIERRADGSVAILDFKTGKPPSEKQVRAGLSPQMPLQGLIARDGGYDALGPSQVEALTYLRFGTQFQVQDLGAAAPRAKLDAKPMAELIAEAETGLVELLTTFANPDHPYLSAPRPERVQYESDFTRLARRDEWTGVTTFD